jgi:hypothetical protein
MATDRAPQGPIVVKLVELGSAGVRCISNLIKRGSDTLQCQIGSFVRYSAVSGTYTIQILFQSLSVILFSIPDANFLI